MCLAWTTGRQKIPIKMRKGEKQSNKPSVRMLELGRCGLGRGARKLAQKAHGLGVIETEAVEKDLEGGDACEN